MLAQAEKFVAEGTWDMDRGRNLLNPAHDPQSAVSFEFRSTVLYRLERGRDHRRQYNNGRTIGITGPQFQRIEIRVNSD